VNDRAVTSDSDEDTEVSPDGAVTLTGRWNGIAGVVNGGYEVAICTKAVALVMPHPDPLVISGFFLRAGTPGPATVRTDLLRAGRCVSSRDHEDFCPQNGTKSLRDHEWAVFSRGPKVRRTRPVRGLGPKEVDLRGTRSPCSAIPLTASNGTGFKMTAVPRPGQGAPASAPTAATASAAS